jgi:hypothetical protein
MSVHKKLMEARIQLQQTKLIKSGHNKFAGYKYFELGDFLPTVQNIFNSIGLCGIVSYDENIAQLNIVDIDDSSSITITSPMGKAALKGVHEVQNIGAVETYQRRYLWVTAMEIVEHDVLDAVTGTDSGTPVKKPESVTPLAGALDNFSAADKELLHGIAEEITWLVKNDDVQAAKDSVSDLTNEEKTALWSLLDSKTRSTLKKGI